MNQRVYCVLYRNVSIRLVRESSAVRRLFVQLAGAVGRQSALHKENSGFAAPTRVSTFPRFVAIGLYFLSETLI
jgi:hypothetical protein